jgi:predicted PurR-regulated permease PerM
MKADLKAASVREPSPPWVFLVGMVLTLAFLYWARPVLIPVALSILLAFLLSPMADGLQKIGLPRVVSVIVVVLIAFSALGSVVWVTARQITSFANELPQYKDNITEKIADLRRLSRVGPLEQVQKTVEDIKKTVDKVDGKTAPAKPAPPVGEIQPPKFWTAAFGGFVEFLTSAGLVVFLVIFMLMEREDLRNRIIRLVGYKRMNVTTKALEEIARRISRYLLMQSLINGTYGLAIAAALFLVGLPYAFLWGFLAGILRFIPYVGPWVGALLPTALGLAVFPGWLWPLSVVALFVVLELCTAMILEPLLYGHSAGVSQVALLVAIAFWTWLWGPVGLMMATPMTVCLVVLGKYIPRFQFIVVLMSDEPVMDSEISYYQRLLASDQDEASEIVEKYHRSHAPELVYDEMLLPALYQAKHDHRQGKLTERDARFIFRATNEIMGDLDGVESGDSTAAESGKLPPSPKGLILACPARDRVDKIALDMLRRLVENGHYRLEIVWAASLPEAVEKKNPAAVCIGAVAPGGVAQTRHLTRVLRARFPQLKILIGRWGVTGDFGDIEGQRKLLLAAGADEVATTLVETRDRIGQLDARAARPPRDGSAPAERNRMAGDK